MVQDSKSCNHGYWNCQFQHRLEYETVTLEGVKLGLIQVPINDFQTYLADEMINFVDTKPRAAKDDRGRFRNTGCSNQHVPSTAVPSTKNPVCRICKLEHNFRMK